MTSTLSCTDAGKRLRTVIKDVLKTWEARARSEIPAARTQDRLSLWDSLPEFLGELANTLEQPKSELQAETNAEIASEHGEDRTESSDYTLEQMIYEYQILREVLLHYLDHDRNLSPEASGVLNGFVDRGIRKASVRFADLASRDQKRVLRDLQTEREVSEKFVATLTHDLRTPLSVVKMTSQLMSRPGQTPEQLQRLRDRVVANIDRIDMMIRDLLDVSRLKAGGGMPVDIQLCRLDQIAESVALDLTQLHGPRFKVENSAGEIQGFWDAEGLTRIFENLCSNAVKYGESETPIVLKLVADAEWVEISVHNDGNPISAEEQSFLFDVYRRTQSAAQGKQKGWGIGLTLVKSITEAHGGSASVKSSPTDGTTFYIRLPRDAREAKSDRTSK